MSRFELARDDLEIAPRTIDGEVVYFIGDPIKLEFHRLDAMQYEVFKKLDGKTSLEDLSAWLLATHDVEAPPEALAEFVETLRGLNLLDLSTDTRIDADRGREIAAKVRQLLDQDGVVFARRTATRPPRATGERRTRHREAHRFDVALDHLARGEVPLSAAQLRGVLRDNPANARARYLLRALFAETLGKPRDVDSVWWWRIPIGNPDRFLGRLAASIGPLVYTRATAVAIACLFLFAWGVLLSDVDRFIVDLKRFFEFRWILEQPLIVVLIWTLGPPQIFLHETAHGLSCRYFGGRVREMGVLIAYLQPTAYCDISSTYLIADKWRRALTCYAGIILDAVVWSGFVLLYHVTDSSTLVGLLAMISIPVKLQSMIAGTNPLIRGDGYFALTELVNYPNLSGDARSYVKTRVLQWITGEAQELPEGAAERSKLFWGYTLGSAVAFALVIGPILLGICNYMVSRLQSVGVLFAAVLIYFAVGRPAVRLVRGVWRGRDVLRRSRRARRVAAVVALGVAGTLLAPVRVTIDAPCLVRPDVAWLRAPFTGQVVSVDVAPDRLVAAGDIVVRLDRAALVVEAAGARAGLQAAELDLQALVAGARAEERGIAEAELGAAARELAGASTQVEAARARAQAGGGRDALDAALAAQAAAQTRYATAEKAVALGRSGPADESVAAARARIEGLRAQLTEVEDRLARADLRSPIDGLVVEATAPIDGLAGQRVETGSDVVGVRRRGGDVLEIRVPAVAPISLLKSGQEVRARLFGLPNTRVVGKVAVVGSAVETATGAELLDGRSFVRVEANLPPELQAEGLPAGLSGTVRIEGDRLPALAHLWLRAVRLYELDLRPLL